MVRTILKRGAISFAISSVAGLLVNLIIDIIVNLSGKEDFVSVSPGIRELLPTPTIAAYINVLLYGMIGATFAMMTFIFEIDRLGFVVQGILYFISTGIVLVVITVFIWKLHRYPQALISTIAGYAVTYMIMGITQYKTLKKDINDINRKLEAVMRKDAEA